MRTAYEAVLHTAVVGPVRLLAGLIDGTVRVAWTAAAVADLVAGGARDRRRLGGSRATTA